MPLAVLIHYGFYIYLVFTAKPQDIRAVGLHQPVGPCDESVKVPTPFGHVLKKNKYLCLENYDEGYFDFNCVKKMPAPRSEWYTVCGTSWGNHSEYKVVVTAFCALGLFWFWQLFYRSGSQPRTKSHRGKQHKD